LGDQIEEMIGACSTMKNRDKYRGLAGKPVGQRKLGRRRHRWEGNIMMDLKEVGWGGIN
jgi:hypothetical protein